MEHIIASLLQDFEAGKMNRRQLIRSLSVAASAAAVVGVTPASAASLNTVGINHISYRVANSSKTRDFYSGLLGLKVSNDTGTKCRLDAGGVSFHVQPGEDEVTRRTPVIDHIAYDIANTKDEILAQMKRLGIPQQHELNHPPAKSGKKKEEGNSVQVKDPDGFHVTLSPKK